MVLKLIERITSFDETGERPGARNGGVIWHTTGSGKSFTMVFLSKALIWLRELSQCRVIIVTDRVDLEDQSQVMPNWKEVKAKLDDMAELYLNE